MVRNGDEMPRNSARDGPTEYIELALTCFGQAKVTIHAETAKMLQNLGRHYLAKAVAASESGDAIMPCRERDCLPQGVHSAAARTR